MATQKTTAVAVSRPTDDQITALMVKAGLLAAPNGSDISRIKVDGLQFHVGDELYISNPKTKEPAFRARLMDMPREYQAAWLDEPLAMALNRPHAANSFCKSYFDDPDQARKHAEDGTSCESCPIGPFISREALPSWAGGKKCSWRADFHLQILDDNGEISDPTVHTLTVSTTGVIQFKGTAREPVKGSVTDLNSMQRLARLAMEQNPDDPNKGLMDGLTALRLGGVIVDIRAIPAKSPDGARTWTVVDFDPVAIVPLDELEVPALEAGDQLLTDDLPF